MFLSTALPGYLRSMTTARHPRPNGNYSKHVFNPTRAVWHFEVDDTNTHENRPIQTKTGKEIVWNKIKRHCRPLECHTAYESGTELKFWFEMSWHLKAIILIFRTRPWSLADIGIRKAENRGFMIRARKSDFRAEITRYLPQGYLVQFERISGTYFKPSFASKSFCASPVGS